MTPLRKLLEKHPRPWRLVNYSDNPEFTLAEARQIFSTGYDRSSSAIIDGNNKRVIALDPSEEEYDVAMTDDIAKLIVAVINNLEQEGEQ